MRFLAEGRTAEVFVWDEGRVLKLDRPEWTGLSHYEAGVLEKVAAAGVSAPKVFDTVSVDGRTGVILEYLEGPSLAEILRDHPDHTAHEAAAFVEFHRLIHRPVAGLPDQIDLLRANIDRAALTPSITRELMTLLAEVDDGKRLLCHGDLNAKNVIMTASGPVAIDWLTATSGVPAADFARSLVLLGWPDHGHSDVGRFVDNVCEKGSVRRDIDEHDLTNWVRIIAAARLDEGFTGATADRLVALATGQLPATG